MEPPTNLGPIDLELDESGVGMDPDERGGERLPKELWISYNLPRPNAIALEDRRAVLEHGREANMGVYAGIYVYENELVLERLGAD